MSTEATNPLSPGKLVIDRVLADEACPRWIKEIKTFLTVKSQFVLYGNIRDKFPFPLKDGDYDLRMIHDYLADFFHNLGFEALILVDPIHGLSVIEPARIDTSRYPKGKEEYLEKVKSALEKIVSSLDVVFEKNTQLKRLSAPAEFSRAVQVAEALVRQQEFPVAVAFDYMMGYTTKGDAATVDPFVRSLILSYDVRINKTLRLYSPVVWLCDRENELPPWFSLNNPRIRSVSVAKPDPTVRRQICRSLLSKDEEFRKMSVDAQEVLCGSYVSQTDALTINDIAAIWHFRSAGGLKVEEIADAARRYKLGITEDPWKKLLEGKTPKDFVAEKTLLIQGRVKGQKEAIDKAATILKKTVRGVSGAQAGASNGKPKGILFLAGPTGTGKTELAKAITEAVFGDEKSYIRFDMAEFSAEHADQRLMGAPPGYIGFEAGGELTQAIHQKPCSVVLFDEIEKAHPRLWDKFLAILDDGQITSGKGERVYFSETIIVFTSNIGMSEVMDRVKNNAGELPTYEDLSAIVNDQIDRYFKDKLGRPELRGRLGDNVVIFDFIRKEVAPLILEKQVGSILASFKKQQGITFKIAGSVDEKGSAKEQLASICCAKLDKGGRGIGERLDTVLSSSLISWLEEHEESIPADHSREFEIRGFEARKDGTYGLAVTV